MPCATPSFRFRVLKPGQSTAAWLSTTVAALRCVVAYLEITEDFSGDSSLFFPTPNSNRHPVPSLPIRYPAPSRLVTIGDLRKSLQALSLVGLADPFSLRLTGGTTVVVQVGDVLDRGCDEIRLLYLLHLLKIEVVCVGGALLTIHGNHEVMNMEGDFRYITRAGLEDFRLWGRWIRVGLSMKRLCHGIANPIDPFRGIPKSFPGIKKEYWEGIRARIAALRPSGPLSCRFLSGNQTAIVVGDSVFVHGGLLQKHIEYGLERINQEVRDWIMGMKGKRSPRYMRGPDALVWERRFSDGLKCDCQLLEGVLAMIPGVRRMVMGHTIQEQGINGVCDARAIRIDVGLSKGCSNGLPEVLEISGGWDLRVITANALHDLRKRKVPAVREEKKEGLALLVTESRLKEVKVNAS